MDVQIAPAAGERATGRASGRPRAFCPDRALAAALGVFWRRGYEGASLTELTEAMGVTRPSLYAAFGNKEALFRKALDLYEREKMAFVDPALAAPTARGVAQRLLEGALQMQTSGDDPGGCLSVIGSVACGVEAESIRQEVVARRAKVEARLRERFARAQAQGDFPGGGGPAGPGAPPARHHAGHGGAGGRRRRARRPGPAGQDRAAAVARALGALGAAARPGAQPNSSSLTRTASPLCSRNASNALAQSGRLTR